MAGRYTSRQKWIMGIGGALVATVVTYGLVRRGQKNGILKRIHDSLDKGSAGGGAGTFGDSEEIKTMPAMDVNFWKKSPITSITSREARDGARAIRKAYKETWSLGMSEDEDAMLAVIKKAKNQADISKIAYQYNALFKSDLYGDFEHGFDSDEMDELWRVIKTKPYR